MNIRYADLGDIPSLLPLLLELGYLSELEELTIRFQRFLKNPGYGVAVCELEETVAGWIAWSRSEFFISNAARFHIEGLVVAAEHRGKQIGKALMTFVEEIAKQHTPAIVDLVSGIRRAKDGSHEFYKSLGYKNEGHMAKLYFRKEF